MCVVRLVFNIDPPTVNIYKKKKQLPFKVINFRPYNSENKGRMFAFMPGRGGGWWHHLGEGKTTRRGRLAADRNIWSFDLYLSLEYYTYIPVRFTCNYHLAGRPAAIMSRKRSHVSCRQPPRTAAGPVFLTSLFFVHLFRLPAVRFADMIIIINTYNTT